MKNYLPSSIILIVMAAVTIPALAEKKADPRPPVVTMELDAHGTDPTAKNHEKLIADLKLTDKEVEPVRKILAEFGPGQDKHSLTGSITRARNSV